MFLNYLYWYANIILNSKFVNKYGKMLPFNYIFKENFIFNDLSIFTKIRFVLFPNFKCVDYNFYNRNTFLVLDFRRKYLPILSIYFNKSLEHGFHKSNVFESLQLFSKFYDFFTYSSDAPDSISNDELDILEATALDKMYFYFWVFKKNFYDFFNTFFFRNSSEDDLIKVYFFFFKTASDINFSKNFGKLKIFNLKKFSSWFLFFYGLFLKNYKYISKETFYGSYHEFDLNYNLIHKIEYIDYRYRIFRELLVRFFFTQEEFNLTYIRPSIIEIGEEFYKKLSSFFFIKFNDFSINKHVNLLKIDNFIFFFLRKNKIFNKGRYSRNRQTYRTGFYWCLWLNILIVYGLHFIFYRFIFSFGYFWLLLFLFFSSFVFSRALKYNYISLNFIVSEIISFCETVSVITGEWFNFFTKKIYTYVLYITTRIEHIFYDFQLTFISEYFKKNKDFTKNNILSKSKLGWVFPK